ncbi:glycosyltransferase family 4 protein [Bradyrhizobium erythrophlei]|uniref:Glycosyltransferase involved in cell wall bisynthesis n=1 Tax=Bradyrhizobium erythrophlei TaxID=1437360 RepID=A0A1M5JQW6_9BRAD|nr:glycosyltransferase family 4 protein [Bradyrhizobium erythrophlei]SHG42976.1 Glycosyltransferase involved in cell wall bisynthesis [Bradyrhizobium erythrophlei]
MKPHLFCVGGEDHHLRIPFLIALRQRGFRVTAAGTGDPSPFSRAEIEYRQYQFDRFDAHTFPRSELRCLARLVRDVQPDLIQAFDTKPNLLVPFAVRHAAPILRTINGMGWVFSSTSLYTLALRPIYCALQRVAARWTAGTVFQNRDDKKFFERYRLLGHSPGYLIGGSGIEIDAFPTAAPSDAAGRERRRASDAGVVITVSRLTKQKGILTLLRAADIVHTALPEVRFILVGPRESEGPFAVPQEEIERRRPYVTALGVRTDVPALLRQADVFAFPSEYREGIPRVLLEAGLAGLPIVTTRMPGCADVVTDGWNGYLVPPRDPQRLARRILDLLHEQTTAAVMGQRSISLVRRKFSLDTIVGQYARIYERVVKCHIAGDRTGSEGELQLTSSSHSTIDTGGMS